MCIATVGPPCEDRFSLGRSSQVSDLSLAAWATPSSDPTKSDSPCWRLSTSGTERRYNPMEEALFQRMPGPEQSEAFVGRQQEEESLLSRPSPAVLALRALLGVHCSSLDCQDDLAPSSSGGEHPTVVKPDHPIKLSHAQQQEDMESIPTHSPAPFFSVTSHGPSGDSVEGLFEDCARCMCEDSAQGTCQDSAHDPVEDFAKSFAEPAKGAPATARSVTSPHLCVGVCGKQEPVSETPWAKWKKSLKRALSCKLVPSKDS
mmetsp:Transcript_19713/g.51155  ORF Transcript_19713/g.51155 Transcript_19713/m.51155 type:complete len:260 (+) Transcript_19713:106-885(+)